MQIREIRISDIDSLHELYLHLHEAEKLQFSNEHRPLLQKLVKWL